MMNYICAMVCSSMMLLNISDEVRAADQRSGANPSVSITDGASQSNSGQDQVVPVQRSLDDPGNRTAESIVGRAGERQNRYDTTSIRPLARIDTRIENRVNSRLRNRIDRSYDPQDNAASSFDNAEKRTSQPR